VLTPNALAAEINGGDAYAAMLAAQDYAGLAAALNAPAARPFSRLVNARTVMAEVTNGAAILDKLEAAAAQFSAVRWALVFLKSEEGLDVGHPMARAQLDGLAGAGVLAGDEAEALKGMASVAMSRAEMLGGTTVTEQDVRNALGV
jgi:hypothetical protein